MTSRPQQPARRRAERTGRRAEWLAAQFLRLKGFSIIERRYKTPGGEIDLIAIRRSLIVFAEVKARADFEEAVFAVTPAARRRIAAAARLFMSRNPALANSDIRYDILAVAGWRIRHVADAWRDRE